MNWIKIIFINIALTFSLLGMVLIAPPVVYSLYKMAKTETVNLTSSDVRSSLELYASYDWAEQHFLEFAELPTSYHDYIVWRRNDYSGSTININNGLRKTSNITNVNDDVPKYWFFGGSTTWGTGVNDEHTYPSLFSKETSSYVINFGESGYIARQSLAYLNNYLLNNAIHNMSDINVIFYDGVNEVSNRCRREIDGLGTGREAQIQNNLKNYEQFSFGRTFNQLQNLLTKIVQNLSQDNSDPVSGNSLYDCASDEIRAREVADTLVDTWELASEIVQNRGGKFTAVLQPVAYYGNPDVSYLDLTSSRNLAAQYQAVYPLIIEAAANKNIRFVDMTGFYDHCTDCYIDYCHVGPQGHRRLVSSLVPLLNE